MTNSNILPGMMSRELEIFVVENVVKAINNGKVIDFTELPLGIIEQLKEIMKSDEQVLLALHDWHPHSEWKRLEQFVSCRFGGLDYNADIDSQGNVQDGEYWDCPNRSTCQFSGVICKLPMVNGTRLNEEDVELIKLSSTEMTNEVIAETLKMPLGSYHKAKARLHHIFKVQTKQGLTKAGIFLNII